MAHAECLVLKATYLEGLRDVAWHRCETCGHDYTGEAATALAEAWWARVGGLGELDPRRVEAAHNLADALVRSGRYEEAERMCRNVLTLMEAEFGPESAHTALAKGSMAECLKYRGHYADAEALVTGAIETATRHLGERHHNTVALRTCRAQILMEQGKYREAERIYASVLAIARETSSEEAPHRMRLENNEALLMLYRRQFVDSERAFRKLLATERRVLGADHPQTVTTTANLALCLTSMGKHVEAMPMETQVLAQRTQILGAQHPETLTSKSNLADCVQWCGDYELAERLHREVLDARRAALGDVHCDTIASAMLLTGVLIARHKGEEAETVIRAAIAVLEASAEMPNDKAAAHSLLAIAMSNQRKYTEAHERILRVVRMCAAAYGEDDVHTREARELVKHMECVALQATCVRCDAPARSACAQCMKTLYCSRACQRADWREHKPECNVRK
jgi:tetratricopeptide (TPR) repeat protein